MGDRIMARRRPARVVAALIAVCGLAALSGTVLRRRGDAVALSFERRRRLVGRVGLPLPLRRRRRRGPGEVARALGRRLRGARLHLRRLQKTRLRAAPSAGRENGQPARRAALREGEQHGALGLPEPGPQPRLRGGPRGRGREADLQPGQAQPLLLAPRVGERPHLLAAAQQLGAQLGLHAHLQTLELDVDELVSH